MFNVETACPGEGGGVRWKIFCQSTLKCGGRGEVGAETWQWMWTRWIRMRLLSTGKISSIHRRREVKLFISCTMCVLPFSWNCHDISKPFCCSTAKHRSSCFTFFPYPNAAKKCFASSHLEFLPYHRFSIPTLSPRLPHAGWCLAGVELTPYTECPMEPPLAYFLLGTL